MEGLRILFLAADPGTMGQVNAGREAREIRERLRGAAHRDAIELVERFAVRPGDLQQTLFEVRPQVVHFSGHGTEDEELVLEGDDGGAELLAKRALTELFRVHKDTVRLVVLSACHSRPQVEAISEHVACAIGMRRAVGARAATEFSAALYLAIGFGASVAMAFESAVAELRARGIPEDRTPQLVVRAGVDARRMILLGSAAGARGAPEEGESEPLRDADPMPCAPQMISIARLPATAAELFGREADLAWLDACWREGVHVATVVAWGGVGKTALVNRWLSTMRDAGWRGAARVYAWSFYSQGTDRFGSSDEFFEAALRWFGHEGPAPASPWEKGERLATLVRKERAILVLDGAEPLQWGPGVQEGRLKDPALLALVKELAAQNQGSCFITTRMALTDLEALGGDKVRSKDLGHLSPEAGAALLRALQVQGTEEELREAAKDYRGHGLALNLLGAYLADVADGDVRRRGEIGALEEEEKLGGHARRVMRSYEPWLGKREAAVLRMIGLFDRPAEEDEIAALRREPVVPGLTDALVGIGVRDWKKALAKLRKAGLLLSDAHDTRVDAHPLVREHFGEQLRKEQSEAWREGHRRLYEHLRAKAKPLPETVEEMAPLYAAVMHGCLAGKNQEALDVYDGRVRRGDLNFSTWMLGAYGSDIAVLSAFFDPPWERLAPGLTEDRQSWVLGKAGAALRSLGRSPEALGVMWSALDMSIARQDWAHAAVDAAAISGLLQSRGELREALVQARKSVELAEKSGNSAQSILRRTTLAATLHAMGLRRDADTQYEEAERQYEEAEVLWARIIGGDMPLCKPRLYSIEGFRYCDLLLDLAQDAEVRDRAAQNLMLAERNQWLLPLALDHISLGRAHLLAVQRGAAGDLAQAAFHLGQAVEGLRHAGQQDYLPLGLLARAALRTHTRDFPAARRDLDEALALATRCSFRLHEADAHLGLARLALAEGHPAEAREHLTMARRIVDDTGYHRRDEELAELHRVLDSVAGPDGRGRQGR